jgi:cyclophilin family peptidyl-prolyl cis-trans isomerase
MEIRVVGDKAPVYDLNLEDLGRFNETPVLPFNAYGTLAWARAEFDNNSASSQVSATISAVGERVESCVASPPRQWRANQWCLPAANSHNYEPQPKPHAPGVLQPFVSCSYQVFFLLKESELTPSGANLLDGRYAVFGYVTQVRRLGHRWTGLGLCGGMRAACGSARLLAPPPPKCTRVHKRSGLTLDFGPRWLMNAGPRQPWPDEGGRQD